MMKQTFGRVLIKISLFSLVTAGVVLPQILFVSQIHTVEKNSDKKNYGKHALSDMEIQIFEDNKKSWMIRSKTAKGDAFTNWELSEVNGDYQGIQNNNITFFGDKGIVDIKTNELSLEENVNAVSSNGYSFETDKITFEKIRDKRFFHSTSPVKLFNKEEKLQVFATGVKGDVATGRIDLLSEVRCRKYVEGYSDVDIESDRAYVNSSLRSIRFHENLKVKQEKLAVKGDEAYFVYDEKSKMLKSVKVNGNILASDGVKTALSEKVEMRLKEDVIIFQGSPRIRMGKNEMVGEEILITNKQKNIQVRRGNIKSTQKGIKGTNE